MSVDAESSTENVSKPATTRGENIRQNDDNACVVCFKNVDFYSVGDCDHPVCYECSTRMRVLCQQNECPICRHILSKVLFTDEILPYRELEAKNRSQFYSKKYCIGFCNAAVQQKFFELLDHPCPKCNTQPYRTFEGLRNHVRKNHDLHYCNICTDHLKIFTFERRCYTQSELSMHLTKGDRDNRSHRGHPLCEYCNKRYLDRDELFRHLRREHYFCHFCDADGCNEFYKDYAALADHFRRDHFLCEEGNCATEQFVGAFRTEIDYKAHIASVHSKSLNKQQAKQTRTLQLEITLGRRGGQQEQGIANLRSRNNDTHHEYMEEFPSSSSQRHPVVIDAGNEEEFPSLGGVAVGPNLSLVRPPPPSIRNHSVTAGLARTKENFPALGSGGGSGFAVNGTNSNRSSAPPVAAMLKKGSTTNSGAVPRTNTSSAAANGMVIHVSNRPSGSQSAGLTKKTTAADFPALPMGKGKKNARNLEEDMISSNSGVSLTNVASKHRTLVEDYVSVANPTTFQKIQMVQKEEMEAKARRDAEKKNAPKLTNADFPSLGKPQVASATSSSWVKSKNEKKQRELENRKSKVAPTPILPTIKTNNKTNNNRNGTVIHNQDQKTKKEKKSKEKKNNQENTPANTVNQTSKINGAKQKEKNNNIEQKLPINKSPSSNALNENSNSPLQMRVPPGFSGAAINPPPGFLSNVTVNSVAKLPNNLTFTSSLGESYNIVPSAHQYTQLPDSEERNQKLVNLFKEVLKTPEALEEFRLLSQKFREGVYKTEAYYTHCQAALNEKFGEVFPELLVLLPDISKQQELYLTYKQHLNSLSNGGRKTLPRLEVCESCKQVLKSGDIEDHQKVHKLKSSFPTLVSTANTKTASGPRK